jgi:hypothetical protein
MYSVFVSDDCDCTYQDFNCGNIHFIKEVEYNRLLNILNASSEQCVYINSNDTLKEDFEGYLIELNEHKCSSGWDF